ncbi:unknown protein (Partial), partial [Seminavis robusta]|eukprot:Sro465_g148510.1 n/a (308) ;mRNA; r:2-989
MRWFGRNRSDKKKQPLIQMVNSVGKDDEPQHQQHQQQKKHRPQKLHPNKTPLELPRLHQPTPIHPLQTLKLLLLLLLIPCTTLTSELDYNIPAKRVTSGEREMILPKHLKKNTMSTMMEKTQRPTSRDDSHSTAVISAISLSTIGASIERELEGAKGLKGKPPLEIKANTHQSVKKKENVGYLRRNFQKANLAVKTAVVSTLPNKVVDGLASAYDTIHAPRNNKDKNLDDVPVTARKYRRDHPDLLLPGNVPRVGFTAIFAAIPLWVKYLAVGAVAAAALTGLALELERHPFVVLGMLGRGMSLLGFC